MILKFMLSLGFIILSTQVAFGADEKPYQQETDVVIADIGGLGLPVDIFRPTEEQNGLAIIVVASGGWNSDRSMLDGYERAANLYSILCSRGYLVFAVRPGSKSNFTGLEMVENVKTTIGYVKSSAASYGIDPERLGIIGWSAGAHLASMASVAPDSVSIEPAQPTTKIAAAGLFFPPTSFLDWGAEGQLYPDIDSLVPSGLSDAEITAKARELSPALNITGDAPPFIIWHGDADRIVPIQQSEFFVLKLIEAGIDVEFHIEEGGGHVWQGISEEASLMADWFDRKLGNPN